VSPLPVGAAALLLCNLAVSLYVIRSSYYSPLQKAAQCFIVWLLPIFGAIFIGSFLRSQRVASQPARSGPSIEGGYDNTISVTDGSHGGFGAGGHDGGSH